ncbi:DUF1272 domain-containing protein [Mycobacterium sp. 050134]
MSVLELRPRCERCGKPLPNGSPDARMCTFEARSARSAPMGN